MIIVTIRTDKPEAELGLYDDERQLGYHTWMAHRELSNTIHTTLAELLKAHDKALTDVQGVVAFQGPGSFTGLRIGLSVANALGYGLSIPVKAELGDDWIQHGIQALQAGEADRLALPKYGADANITQQKK